MSPFNYDNFQFYACYACIMFLYAEHDRYTDLQEVYARFKIQQPANPEDRLEEEVARFVAYANPKICAHIFGETTDLKKHHNTKSHLTGTAVVIIFVASRAAAFNTRRIV